METQDKITPTGMVSRDFNRISDVSLTRIYNEFCNKQKVKSVKGEVTFTISMN